MIDLSNVFKSSWVGELSPKPEAATGNQNSLIPNAPYVLMLVEI
jgi:hypothetical protein